MFSKNCIYCCAIGWLLLTTPAWSRTWTSSTGKEIEADFVDADEQTVTLRKSDGNEVKFKIELLSDPDQQIIRDILLRRGAKEPNPQPKQPSSKLPVVKAAESADEPAPATEKKLFGELTPVTKAGKGLNAEEKTTANSTKPPEKPKGIKVIERKWTNLQGKTISGKFVKMQEGNVMILATNRQIPAPFDQLSLTDQQYVVEVLTSRGEKINLPNAPPNGNVLAANNLPQPNLNPAAVPAALPMPMQVPMPGMTPDLTASATAAPEELVKAYGGFKLRDGTPITPAMIAELTPDQLNNLRSYLNYPEQGRQEMAQIVIGSALEMKKRMQGNSPSQPYNAASVAQVGSVPPGTAPPGTIPPGTMPNPSNTADPAKSGTLGIPNVNSLVALANEPPATTPMPLTQPPPTTTPTQIAAVPTPMPSPVQNPSPHPAAHYQEPSEFERALDRAAQRNRWKGVVRFVWLFIVMVIGGISYLVKKMRGEAAS